MKNKIEEEYEQLLKSGMFWEFFPQLTGNWGKDEDYFVKFYNERKANHETNSIYNSK